MQIYIVPHEGGFIIIISAGDNDYYVPTNRLMKGLHDVPQLLHRLGRVDETRNISLSSPLIGGWKFVRGVWFRFIDNEWREKRMCTIWLLKLDALDAWLIRMSCIIRQQHHEASHCRCWWWRISQKFPCSLMCSTLKPNKNRDAGPHRLRAAIQQSQQYYVLFITIFSQPQF